MANTKKPRTKMTISELPVAVDFYIKGVIDGSNRITPLMELLQQQTPEYQKQFWEMAEVAFDAAQKEINK